MIKERILLDKEAFCYVVMIKLCKISIDISVYKYIYNILTIYIIINIIIINNLSTSYKNKYTLYYAKKTYFLIGILSPHNQWHFDDFTHNIINFKNNGVI